MNLEVTQQAVTNAMVEKPVAERNLKPLEVLLENSTRIDIFSVTHDAIARHVLMEQV